MRRTPAILVAVLWVAAIFPECSSLYYQVRPTIDIEADPFNPSKVGEYASDYSRTKENIRRADLYVIEDPNFGCRGYIPPSNDSLNNYTLPSRTFLFAVMLPYQGRNGLCSEYERAQTAHNNWGATGLIFRYSRDDPQGGSLRSRPSQEPQLSGITIVTVELERNDALLDRARYQPHVTITAHYHPFQTSQTFYFIVFAFCILMLLSCLWFVMSYIKRCHYSIQRRRRRVSGCQAMPTVSGL